MCRKHRGFREEERGLLKKSERAEETVVWK
jgi:hypothetical protein